MRGVPGGGRISENSDARVKMGDCVGERVVMRFGCEILLPFLASS